MARVADDVARAATAETLRRRREKFGIEDGAGDQMVGLHVQTMHPKP